MASENLQGNSVLELVGMGPPGVGERVQTDTFEHEPDGLGAPCGAPPLAGNSQHANGTAQGQRTRVRNRLRLALVGGDVAAVVASWGLILAAIGVAPAAVVAVAATGATVVVFVARCRGLYLSRVSSIRSIELAELVRASAAGACAGVVVLSTFIEETPLHFAQVVAVLATLQFLMLAASRSIFDDWLKRRRVAGDYCRSLLLFGFDDDAARLTAILGEQPELGFRVVGYVGPIAAGGPVADVPDRLGDYADAQRVMAELGVSGVLVAAQSTSTESAARPLESLLRSGAHIHVSAGLRGIDPRRVKSLPIAHEPLLYIERSGSAPRRDLFKRVLDLLLAPLLVVLACPVVLVAAIAIKRHDGGPVFFGQERIGRDGRPFRVWKLRTMEVNAADRQAELRQTSVRTGPLFKAPDDPRVTGPGRVLRLLSIDELPQLWNVLRGQMTLVGPRPALESEVEEFDEDLRRRHDVRPGVTGLWQVEARDNPSFSAYRRLDLFYVDNWSVSLDLVIILLTAHSVLLRAAHAIGRRLRPGQLELTSGSLDG